MRILIINVCLRDTTPKKLFPIGLGYIATALKNAGYGFDVLDLDAERPSEAQIDEYLGRNLYDVYCLGCVVSGFRIIRHLSEKIKRYAPNSTVIVGNSVATSIPEILLRNTKADIAVLSEGDLTIVDLLDALKSNRDKSSVNGICYLYNDQLVKTADRLPMNISKVPFIDYDLFNIDEYIKSSKYHVNDPCPVDRDLVRAIPINFSRGCVAKCTFCYQVFRDYKYRRRSEESIIGEIQSVVNKYSINYVRFWDDLTFASKKHILGFCDALEKAKVKVFWSAQCRANLFTKEEDKWVVERMKENGCAGVIYSLESSDESILRAMNKRISVDDFGRQTKLLHEVGIPTWTSIVIGYPEETKATIRATFECCKRNKIYPSSGFLLPQPGSEMYQYALDKGFIRDEVDYLMKMGDRQDLTINLTSMDSQELVDVVNEEIIAANKEFGLETGPGNLAKTQFYKVDHK